MKNLKFFSKTFLLLLTFATSKVAFAEVAPTATTDPGVVINGVRWATRNVDGPGTFAATPQDAGMFYQWNRPIGWSPINPRINSRGETTWDSSNHSGTYWSPVNCPCPAGWRVPTKAELHSLSNAGSTWVSNRSGTGVVFGTSPNQIFLPAAGFRSSSGGALSLVDTGGTYWSSTQSDGTTAWGLWLSSGFSNVLNGNRAAGHSIRCVAEN